MEKTLQKKRPLDRTGVEWTPAQLKLLAKGQTFVPSPHKVDRVSKYKDFMAFATKLRLALYFIFSRIRQECSKKFYQPGNHKLQAGSWLKKIPSSKPERVWEHAPLENFKN